MSGGALHGLRVFDLSESVAGQYCSRLLSDYGAEVTLVEPPSGSALRRVGPVAHTGGQTPHGESLLFFHLNLGKRSLTLDPATPSGWRILCELAPSADVILVGPSIDRDALLIANPRCIVALVSGFGDDGPYRDWKGGELIYQAVSGMMNHNGIDEREPLYGVGERASYAAGTATYISILTALLAREQLGIGQEVAVDVAETGAAMWYPFVTQYIYNGSLEARGDRRQPLGQVECRGGWVCFWIHDHRWQAACAALDAPELLDDPRFAHPRERQNNWNELVGEIQNRVREWEVDVLVQRWQANRMVAARAYTPSELFTSCEHLKQRGFFETIDTALGPRTILGPPWIMSATPRHVTGGPPTPGERNADIYAKRGITECEMDALSRAGAI
jgi:crotonobetainyl-CoA:carnitine CoA-transferase CaiB-like acyl-CoA transferase